MKWIARLPLFASVFPCIPFALSSNYPTIQELAAVDVASAPKSRARVIELKLMKLLLKLKLM